MSEPAEVQLARQSERLRIIQEMLSQDRAEKQEIVNKIEQMYTVLMSIDNRVRVLEKSVSEQSSLYVELEQLKHEIAGAKKIIRWLWIAVSSVIAFGISIKTQILDIASR